MDFFPGGACSSENLKKKKQNLIDAPGQMGFTGAVTSNSPVMSGKIRW
jgi:translation elongation factor EF-G